MSSFERQQLISRKMQKLKEEIATLDDEIARLQAKRKEKEAALEELRTLSSPHQLLPSEILALIFENTKTYTPFNPLGSLLIPSMLTPTSSPWNVRQVCSEWRQIALSTKTLWNDVTFERAEQEKGRPSDSLGAWESRMHFAGKTILPKDGPLHVEFSYDLTNEILGPSARGAIIVAIEFLKARQDRIVSLSFRCRAMFYLFATTYTMRRINLPSLRRLSWSSLLNRCSTIVDPFTPETDRTATFFSSLIPKTHTLDLSGHSLAFDEYLHFIRTSQISAHLTTLHLLHRCYGDSWNPNYDWETYTQVLSQCTKLKSLTLILRAPLCSSPEGSGHPRVVLPDLKSFKVSDTIAGFVLDTFTLPSLSYLCYEPGYLYLLPELVALLKRSQCSLKTFIDFNVDTRRVVGKPVDAEQWDELITHLDTVEELRTTTIFHRDDLLRLGQAQILPNVKKLSIRVEPDIVMEVYELIKDRFCLPSSKQAKAINHIYHVEVAYSAYVPPELEDPETGLPTMHALLERDILCAQTLGTHLDFTLDELKRFRRKFSQK